MLVKLVTVKKDLNILNYYGEEVKVGGIREEMSLSEDITSHFECY